MNYTRFTVKPDPRIKPVTPAPLVLLEPDIEPMPIPEVPPPTARTRYANAPIIAQPRIGKKAKRHISVKSILALLLCAGFCSSVGYLFHYAYSNKIIAPKVLCNLTYRLAAVSSGADSNRLMLYKTLPKKSPTVLTDTASHLIKSPVSTSPQPSAADDPVQKAEFLSPGGDAAQSENSESVAVSSEKSEAKSETGATAHPLLKKDLSRGSDKIYLSNETAFKPDIGKLSNTAVAAFASTDTKLSIDKPLVLVLHTHGTENYMDSDSDFYSSDNYVPRTEDTMHNVVRVGAELTNILNSYGIPTVHCEIMHDKNDFVGAYKNSLKSAQDYLKKYPSIKYVIDLHRDSIIAADQAQTKPFTVINGESTAQVMLVVGTSGGGAAHPGWQNNLSFALNLQNKMNKTFPTLARPINLRNSRFNQHVSDGAFIVEVGSAGNTLDEALTAVRLFAQCFAKTLTNK